MSNAHDIRHYAFQRKDRLFLDANIWLCVYGPVVSQDWRTGVYSAALKRMRMVNCEVYVDVLVLSEFINRFARVEYEQLPGPQKPQRFKDFRESAAFLAIAEDIAVNARKVLNFAKRCDSGFASLEIAWLLSEFQAGRSDFNDLVIADVCKRNSLKLVTHDRDFKDKGLTVVTANRHLLA